MNEVKPQSSAQLTITKASIAPPKRFGDKARVSAVMSDGSQAEVFSYFSDELSFSAEEFKGLTLDQALNLFVKRDTAYLRS